ncbi:MAG: EAL domain-containing protein [Methylobacter sp.]|jgi:EAL domain-containing protein (putative c-di-GMP-specific phosphodiesterase class I)|nr:EAL domain-containing protein [Methylobacter sp.]
MNTFYNAQATDNNHIPRGKFMTKKLKKKLSNTRQDQYALIKKQSNAMQKLHKNKGKLHIFSSQLTRLIDAIPDAVLLKDREGRKLVTNRLTKSLFKLHDVDWYGKTDITAAFAHQEICADHEHDRTLKSELSLALEKRQFKLYYQIQVDSNRQLLGAEALLRWEHPQYGLLAADQFIPIAEQTNLILPIGIWVLKTACEQLKLWQADPLKKKLQIAVNISPCQFSHPDFVEQLRRTLEETGVNAKRLKLELTESLMLHDISNTIKKMKALKLLGIRFSMDNFGTGYSSLSQLKKLPIDQLKIDPFLMRDIAIDSGDAMIVKTVIAMTNKLEIDVIAAGVETEQQFICLKHLGCSAYQGHLFGNPMPLNEFEKLLNQAASS